MAFSPRIDVRLSPVTLDNLKFIAERQADMPARLARHIITSWVGGVLRANGWEREAQEHYWATLQAIVDAGIDDAERAAGWIVDAPSVGQEWSQ